MRILILAAALVVTLPSTGRATKASWPITPTVEYPNTTEIGPAGARATVRVVAGDGASAVDVEVYGLDGMRVGDDNLIHLKRDHLAKGETLVFDVTFHPGPGRSSLVVVAKAHFENAGDGSTVRDFPFGEENAAQRYEHTRCVRQDPDGVWIRLMDCDEEAAATDATPPVKVPAEPAPVTVASEAAPPSLPPLTLTIRDFLASPPVGLTVRTVGYVVDSYFCPPCPKGAECKPCSINSAIFMAATPHHAAFDMSAPPADVVSIATDDPSAFEKGVQYRVEITVTARTDDGFDGRLLRSQRPDREPIWTDLPAQP